eukprot:1147610-Pelagomonas_calceolata.AAC.2
MGRGNSPYIKLYLKEKETRRKEKKTTKAWGKLPTPTREKEKCWLKRAGSPLHHDEIHSFMSATIVILSSPAR